MYLNIISFFFFIIASLLYSHFFPGKLFALHFMAFKRGLHFDFMSVPSKLQRMDDRVVLGDIGNFNEPTTSQRVLCIPPKEPEVVLPIPKAPEVVLPIVDKAPFLYRNHRGYNILSSGGGINDVKDAVSLEHKKLRVSAKNFAKKKLSVKRAPEESALEDAVVRMKKEHLFNLFSKGCDSRAADLIVFEFFNIIEGVAGKVFNYKKPNGKLIF